jgi:hypothetical protein
LEHDGAYEQEVEMWNLEVTIVPGVWLISYGVCLKNREKEDISGPPTYFLEIHGHSHAYVHGPCLYRYRACNSSRKLRLVASQPSINFTMSVNPSLTGSPPVPRAAHSPRSPPLHQFEDPLEDDAEEQQQPDDAEDEDEIPYPEPGSEQTLLPPPNFKPFFTLIDDTTSGEHFHPYVHYVFADDDPAIVTAASMRSLGLDDTKYMPHDAQDDGERQQAHERGSEDGEEPLVESPLPPPIPGVKEHYLIVDLGADGRTIVDAQSLSPEWQITESSIRTAPSFDESSPDQGYMLRVEGIEISSKNKGKGKGQAGDDKLNEARDKSQGDIFDALDSLVQDIEGGLKTAAKIVGVTTTGGQDTVVDVRVAEDDKGITENT